VLQPPLAVDLLDAPAGVLGDLAAAMWAQPRVVVDRVVAEVRGDQVSVPGVERLVVGADVIEMADDGILTAGCRFGCWLFVVRVKAAKGPLNRGGKDEVRARADR
jgi:hypothetical protein